MLSNGHDKDKNDDKDKKKMVKKHNSKLNKKSEEKNRKGKMSEFISLFRPVPDPGQSPFKSAMKSYRNEFNKFIAQKSMKNGQTSLNESDNYITANEIAPADTSTSKWIVELPADNSSDTDEENLSKEKTGRQIIAKL